MNNKDDFNNNDDLFVDLMSSASKKPQENDKAKEKVNLYTGNGEATQDGQISLSSFATNTNTEPEAKKKSGKYGRKSEIKDEDNSKFRIWKRIGRIALTIVLIGVITGGIGLGTVITWLASEESKGTFDMDDYDLEGSLDFTTTIYVQNKKGEYVEYKRLHGMYNRIWMNGEDIPDMLKNSFIAIEDKRFMDHSGVDWKRTVGGFINSFVPIYGGRQGGSTITQQLVKNLTMDNDVTAMRKVREIMRARYLEDNYSKESILEWYLNTIPMGTGIYGVEVAANYYFGKTVNELTIAECASLASITQSPEQYRPDLAENEQMHLERRNTIIKELYDQDYISEEEYDKAVNTKLKVVADKGALNAEDEDNSDFVDALIDDVIEMLVKKKGYDKDAASEEFYNAGYKIYSTLVPKVQKTLEKVYKTKSYFSAPVSTRNYKTTPNSSMTVMDYEGHICGIIGGKGSRKGSRLLNRATSSPRQCGSSMKPIGVYSLAMEYNAITYSTMLEDRQMSWSDPSIKGGWPNNWDFSYRGTISTEYALYHSVNTTAVSTLRNLIGNGNDNYQVANNGIDLSYDFLTTKLGLKHLTDDDKNFSSLALGGCAYGVTSEELTAAYAIFGNLGYYYKPTTYTVIYDQFDNVVDDTTKDAPIVAISEDTATCMNHLLRTVVTKGTGIGAKAGGFDIYAKTGTTTDSQDLWFAGGTPYYVGACWYGFDNPQKYSPNGMNGYFNDGTNVSAAAMRIWSEVMDRIHEGLPEKKFVDSEYAEELSYCTSTGLIASSGCSKAKGWYRKDNIPDTCTHVAKKKTKKKDKSSDKSEEKSKDDDSGDGDNADTSDENTEKPETSDE